MDKFTYTGNGDPAAIDALYESYLQNAESVDPEWKKFFEGIEFAQKSYPQKSAANSNSAPLPIQEISKEFKVINLINAYRSRGHLFTETNPVRQRRQWGPPLDIENFALENADLESEFDAGNVIGIGRAKLKDIILALQNIYCRSIGFEFMYMRSPSQIGFITDRIDILKTPLSLPADEKKHIYNKLSQAVLFEKYLGKKFTGQKRFSLEGGESLIPALDTAIETGSSMGIREFFIGMAHRGRLNVLANIFKKPFEDIFVEFEGYEFEDDTIDGDVKYHLGQNSVIQNHAGDEIKMNLLPNPSHLEAVDPLVEGMTRAFAENDYNEDYDKVCPILIHGDAAIAGQGVVYEVIQMQHLEGYKTGGTIHIVINNQVGFTTNFTEGRSSIYCTDVGKVTLSPVFHVNGDDPEAMVFAMKLAMEFRQKFHKDVFIDLLCYRKYGHNEGDEPRFTQPVLYKAIDTHPDPRAVYGARLLSEGMIDSTYSDGIESEFNALLDSHLERAKTRNRGVIRPFLADLWGSMKKADDADFEESPDTGIELEVLRNLANSINTLPAEMNFIRKVSKIYEDRAKMTENDRLDWALGETLAYASLLAEGYSVRLSGQDCVRGTFSHRHAILKTEDAESEYCPLNNLGRAHQGKFRIYNSLLSEYAVMGFDYGYALANPHTLTLWEAQFGDFGNGAQIIVDQFLSSAEDKWNSQNGLVLLLPHGYEGQGAEHSSARLERFLILCAELNMQVVNCTTPANMFHVLRRQLKRNFRKPLIVMTPKSLLRHPVCVSSLSEMAEGKFEEVYDDEFADPENVDKVVFCTGKIYYDLIARREKTGQNNMAIVRLEQLYPFPMQKIVDIRDKYVKAVDWLWAQEEPENMGAWWYISRKFTNKSLKDLEIEVVAQPESASPATGSSKKAAIRHTAVLDKVFEQAISVNEE